MTEEAYLSDINQTLKNFYQTNELYTNNIAGYTELLVVHFETFVVWFNVFMVIIVGYIIHHIYDSVWKR